jgi:predicted Zn-dependent peptidase
MIFALALAALSGPQVLEYPDPKAPNIVVQAVVKLGPLSGREQAMAQIIDDTLLDATDSYDEGQIWQYSTLAGESMKCSLSGDHFRIQLTVPKGQMSLAGELTAELLEHSRLTEGVIQSDIVTASIRPASYWSELLQPFKLNYKKMHHDEVMEFYHKVFVPANTTIAVAGPFTTGEGQAAMDKYIGDWSAPKVPSYVRHIQDPPPPLLGHHAFPVTTVELYGPEYGSSEADFAANLLVTTALGVGKGSSMFRVLREKMDLSYIQQAIVAPTPGGFQTHLVMIVKPSAEEAPLVDTMRAALAADVATWNEDTRKRALGMALAFLQNEAIATPLYLDGASAVGFGHDDHIFLNAYWTEKMGNAWDPGALLTLMRQVTLEDMKKMASDLVANAQGGVIHGGT